CARDRGGIAAGLDGSYYGLDSW
nr:immunoglobulin heavy chain junction region [Macaca mulatta]